MENFRDLLKLRLRLAGLYCGVMLILNGILGLINDGNPFTSFILGALMGIQLIVIVLMFLYYSALKDETKLKKMYIKETDERQQLIRLKAGSTGIVIITAGLLLTMAISGYYSKVVFFTLLGVVAFMAVVALLLKLYYNKKL